MRRKFSYLQIAIVVLLLAGLAAAGARAMTNPRPGVIGGGGGHLEQGQISLDNTLAQPVVGVIGNGTQALCAGFWCGVTGEQAIYLPLVVR